MQRATERNMTRKLSRLCKKHRNCAAGNARPTRIRRPTGARPFRHKRTCHEAQYPGGPERVLRTRRRRPQHCTRRGLHSARGGRSAPHAAVGLPRTGQSLGHGRCHATSTNEHCTRRGLHSSVWSANCMPLRGSRRPAGPLGTGCHAKLPALWSQGAMPSVSQLPAAANTVPDAGSTVPSANCMHCMPCGHRVPCGHRCAMPTQQSRCPTRIGACYRVGERRSWRILAVVEPCLDLCRCGCWPRPCSCGRP